MEKITIDKKEYDHLKQVEQQYNLYCKECNNINKELEDMEVHVDVF